MKHSTHFCTVLWIIIDFRKSHLDIVKHNVETRIMTVVRNVVHLSVVL